jgi:HSP20 family protein
MVQSDIEKLLKEDLSDEQVSSQGGHTYVPQADVYETAHEIIVLVDLPGISKENVDLFISGTKIIIEAIKRDKKTPRNARYYCIERLFGKVQRTVDIPAPVHTGKVEAIMQNGVLVIRMPKIEDRRGSKRRIEIR